MIVKVCFNLNFMLRFRDMLIVKKKNNNIIRGEYIFSSPSFGVFPIYLLFPFVKYHPSISIHFLKVILYVLINPYYNLFTCTHIFSLRGFCCLCYVQDWSIFLLFINNIMFFEKKKKKERFFVRVF